jgi:hypothetical protein
MLIAVDWLRLSEGPDSVAETAIQQLIYRITLARAESSGHSERSKR